MQRFADLKTLLAKATPIRSGDQLAGIAATSYTEMVAAQSLLANLPISTFLTEFVIPPEEDEVTRLILKQHDSKTFQSIAQFTVGECRDFLLSKECTTEILTMLQYAFTPEMVAAISKIMRNQDLIAVSKKCRVITKFRNTIGLEGRFSTRLQPNDPCDNLHGITSALVEGLLYGCGDAVIGVNPASDNLDQLSKILLWLDTIRQRLNAPIQTCVLTHISNSILLAKQGVPIDLFFQSIGGTEAVNKSFGINLATLKEAHDLGLKLNRGTVGNHCMYFETGQGSALSANAHHGVDQQTLDARAYAVAREFSPLLVNTVVGFIGPEYLLDGKQITRAALEDHFCGKLLGLPMGCDVCYTNHSYADQDDMDNLLVLLAQAGCTFVMAIPGADDVMLNYQSTSYQDSRFIRNITQMQPSPEFVEWQESMKITRANQLTRFTQNSAFDNLLPGPLLMSNVCGDSSPIIENKTRKAVFHASALENALAAFNQDSADRVVDLSVFSHARLGRGHAGGQTKTNDWLAFQLDYAQAKDAVAGKFSMDALAAVIAKLSLSSCQIHSRANDTQQFLLRPDLGRCLAAADEALLQKLIHSNPEIVKRDLLIIVSGGLSPIAIQRHAGPFLSAFLPLARQNQWSIAPVMIAPRSRVALGDQVNALMQATMVVMLIGERPGLSSPDSMGIYFTYHAEPGCTDERRNCLSNIHAKGLSVDDAALRLSYMLGKAFKQKYTGVELKDDYVPALTDAAKG